MSRVLGALILALATAFAAFAQTPKQADARKSICVISHIGAKFALKKIGFTAFQNSLNEVNIEAWGIDDAVVSKVAASLTGRYAVHKVSFARTAFSDFEKEGGLFRDHEGELATAVRRIAAGSPQKCDAYLVALRSSSAFSGTNQVLAGLGLVEASNPFVATYNLHALYSLRLYDGRTFAVRSSQTATLGQGPLFTITSGPHRQVDATWWPASTSVAGHEKLRTATRTLVEQSLAKTLPELLRSN
jgi:hypothetical protein